MITIKIIGLVVGVLAYVVVALFLFGCFLAQNKKKPIDSKLPFVGVFVAFILAILWPITVPVGMGISTTERMKS